MTPRVWNSWTPKRFCKLGMEAKRLLRGLLSVIGGKPHQNPKKLTAFFATPFKGASMNQIINLPGIKSVKAEAVSYGVRATYYITRVNFKDGRTVTLQGELPKKEAFYQAYFQRALDAGLTNDEAHEYA